MKLILVRHGETFENAAGFSQGHADTKLTHAGNSQAGLVAQRLKDEKIDFAYSSDLSRAVDTLKKILMFHPKTKHILTNELREQAKGIYERKPRTEIRGAVEKENVPYYAFKPEGGETLYAVWDKVVGFYEKIRIEHADDTVLVVSHGSALACLFAYLDGKTIKYFRQYLPYENTSVTMISIKENEKPEFTVMNCSGHLSKTG